MASHITCDAQRKGLEAQIASLTEGYGQEILRLQREATSLLNHHKQEVLGLQGKITEATGGKNADIQAIKDDMAEQHALETEAIRVQGEIEISRLNNVIDELTTAHALQTTSLEDETRRLSQQVKSREEDIVRLKGCIDALTAEQTREAADSQAARRQMEEAHALKISELKRTHGKELADARNAVRARRRSTAHLRMQEWSQFMERQDAASKQNRARVES
jgi:hypothetical protein